MKKIDPHKPLTDKEWESLGPVMYGIDGLPEEAQEAVRNVIRSRPKPTITLRLDAELVAHLRDVPLYNARINDLLNEAWKEGRL